MPSQSRPAIAVGLKIQPPSLPHIEICSCTLSLNMQSSRLPSVPTSLAPGRRASFTLTKPNATLSRSIVVSIAFRCRYFIRISQQNLTSTMSDLLHLVRGQRNASSLSFSAAQPIAEQILYTAHLHHKGINKHQEDVEQIIARLSLPKLLHSPQDLLASR